MTMRLDSVTVLEEVRKQRQPRSAVRIVQTAALVLVLAVGIALLARNWSVVLPALQELSPRYWVPSIISALVAMACATQSWRLVLNGLGPHVRVRRSAPVFLVGPGQVRAGAVWATSSR